MTDIDQVTKALAVAGRSMTASEVARVLKVSRKEVNSVLYSGLGSRFLRSEDEKPKWSLLSATRMASRRDDFSFQVQPGGPIHVDQQGGDWTVTVASAPRSRNDPPYEIEMTGVRVARVTVNTTLLGQHDRDDWASANLVAAFALTNQILLTRLGDSFSDQNPEMILRDTLLSFGASGEATD